MWAEINGERKKVACGPCIRGHRSSKCDHRDRVLVEVRKPGRPLSSCPHPSGSCSCERVVINYTIPKSSECACPSERAPTVASVTGNNNRVQKNRSRKGTNTLTPASLERAIKTSQDGETDSYTVVTRTPTNTSFTPSENSTSNGASPPSSASSTPRILPSPSRKQSSASDVQMPDVPSARPMSSSSRQVADCCKAKSTRPEPESQPQKEGGSCCSGKAKEVPQPAAIQKSCCSGKPQSNPMDMIAQMNSQPTGQNFAQLPQFQQQGSVPNQPYGMVNPGFSYNMPGNMGMPLPFGFNIPIYNHMVPGFHSSTPMQTTQTQNEPNHNGHHESGHNCHCGDTCSCFGCADHPSNATMTEYIRLMHHYMSTGGFGAMPPPTYDLPTYPHHPGYGAEASQGMGFTSPVANFTPFSAGQIPFQANVNPAISTPNTPGPSTTYWPQAPIHTPTTAEPQYFNPLTTSGQTALQVKTEETTENSPFADSPSDGKDGDTPTLSPSAYMWQELVLPGCNDATGTCQCGDGCECVGCLTHGGHNGVPLDPPTAAEDAAFTEFMASNDIAGNDTELVTGSFSEGPS